MEESISSSMSSSFSCSMDGSEESGWTMYLEDFMASEERSPAAGGCSSSSDISLSSTISDAASSTFAAWQKQQQQQSSAKADAPEDYRKLRLKGRKGLMTNADSLEDTASSSVNGPKVTETYSITNPTKKDYQSLQTGTPQVMNEQELKEVEDEFKFTEGTNGCSMLKNRGLYLVPLSMLVDQL